MEDNNLKELDNSGKTQGNDQSVLNSSLNDTPKNVKQLDAETEWSFENQSSNSTSFHDGLENKQVESSKSGSHSNVMVITGFALSITGLLCWIPSFEFLNALNRVIDHHLWSESGLMMLIGTPIYAILMAIFISIITTGFIMSIVGVFKKRSRVWTIAGIVIGCINLLMLIVWFILGTSLLL